jgi:hypothetical protein
MAGPVAPNYDNVLWPGGDGLRIPQEVAPATLAVTKLQSINVGGAGTTNTVNLTAAQSQGSEYVITNAGSGTTTINWPANLVPVVFCVYNNSGQATSLEVATANAITGPANGKRALFVLEATVIIRLTSDV